MPLEIEAVWQEIDRKHPEFKREFFPGQNGDPYMLNAIVVGNEYRYTPKAGAMVMDIGANRGVFTVLCAANGASVVSYEPNRLVFPMLLDAIERSGAGGTVYAIPKAVWATTGEVAFAGRESDFAPRVVSWRSFNGRVMAGEDTRMVECVSLDDAVGDAEWDCVKMDIEGGEYEVLAAAPDETLQRIGYLTVELHAGHGHELPESIGRLFDVQLSGSYAYATRRDSAI